MVKSELLKRLCNLYPNILHRDMGKILEIIFNEIGENLYKGNNIEIRGFGSYKTVIRKARIGRNPKNSETVEIPAKKAIRWKMSKNLYSRLNENKTYNIY